jgi:hypothetical protein
MGKRLKSEIAPVSEQSSSVAGILVCLPPKRKTSFLYNRFSTDREPVGDQIYQFGQDFTLSGERGVEPETAASPHGR